jgi:hypothetical protein
MGVEGNQTMVIDEKLGNDYIIGCECDDFFIVKRLGPSVECPHCGKTELPSAMLTKWTLTHDDVEGTRAVFAIAAS